MKREVILKSEIRTLLELETGIAFTALLLNIIGVSVIGLAGLRGYVTQGMYSLSLWFGAAFAAVSAVHMLRTLDRGLGLDVKSAQRRIYLGYLTRYGIIIAVVAIICITECLEPISFFIGYMSLKLAAYEQPLMHKIYNKALHTTDPIPEPLPDEDEDAGGLSE